MTLTQCNAALNETFINRGSDKGDVNHSFRGRTYLDVYETIMSPKRFTPVSILEIGVCGGCSMQIWDMYFEYGKIFGIDIDPDCLKFVPASSCIKVFIGSQADRVFLSKVVLETGPLDFVIDDGSHFNEFTLESFKGLWPEVKPGGWYIIEDLQCSYGPPSPDWPGMRHNARTDWNQTREPIDAWLKGLITDLDFLKGEVRQIQIHPMQILIQKV